MRFRALIFEDDAGQRSALRAVCVRRGYEVLTFAHPGLCPLHAMDRCPCPPGTTCADFILSDLQMPRVYGLDFVEALLQKQCAVPHLALMSGFWTPADEARAVGLGCRLFRKPFSLRELDAWLDTAETLVPPDRGLLELTPPWAA
jgi:DNA-binding response OmpR family regulator